MTDKTTVTTGLITLMVLLGVADGVLVEGLPTTTEPATVVDTNQRINEPTNSLPSDAAPVGAVRKNQGPDVLQTLISNTFTFGDSRDTFILAQVVDTKTDTLNTKALLIDGDRAGAIGWIDSPNVKRHYLVLKEALHSAFTPDIRDLLDETQRRENHPTRNLLTFIDPGILPERVVFVRVRERLYEFHIAEGSSDVIFNLIEDLTD